LTGSQLSYEKLAHELGLSFAFPGQSRLDWERFEISEESGSFEDEMLSDFVNIRKINYQGEI